MNYFLRTFFYSLGLALLFAAFALNPATAQFADMLSVLHTAIFWQIVGLVAMTLCGADLVFSGNAHKAVDAASNMVGRLRDSVADNRVR